MLIRWILIYPVDSAIQLLNNWGLDYTGDDYLSATTVSHNITIPQRGFFRSR